MKKVITSIFIWMVFLLPIQLWAQENDQAVLIIHGMNKSELDKMPSLSIIEYGIVNNRLNEPITPEIQGTNAIYRFTKLKDDKVLQIPRNVSLILSNVPFYILTPGDSINIQIHKNEISFSGRGYEKFKILFALNRIKQERQKDDYEISLHQVKENFGVLDLQEDYLYEHKHLIPENTFYTILSEIRLFYQIQNYWILGFNISSNGIDTNVVRQLQERDAKINKKVKSYLYSSYVITKYGFEEVKLKGLKFDFNTAFNYIVSNYDGLNREALLTYLISNYLKSLSISHEQLHVLSSFKNETLKRYIDILTKGRIDGAEAPTFSLTGMDGKEYSSEMFAGKVLVMDFWFTGCGACQDIPPILGPLAEKYKDRDDVIFLSISLDKDMEKWKDSVNKGLYTFDHSLHLYTTGKGRNHSIINDFNVRGCPTILLISKSGRILSIPDSARNDNGKSLEKKISHELNNRSFLN